MITRDELLTLHKLLTDQATEIMKAKNQDYASAEDVFRNFRYFGGLGILVRLSDKLARLRSFEDNGSFAVKDEALRDTVIDAINYAVLYFAFKQEESGTAPTKVAVVLQCDDCENPADYESTVTTAKWCMRCADRRHLDFGQMIQLRQKQ